MAKLNETYAQDDDLIESGAWVTLIHATKPGEKPFRVKLRSITSKKYRQEENRVRRKYRTMLLANDQSLPPDDQDEYDILCAQRGLVVDWEGAEEPDGSFAPYTPKNVETKLRTYPQLRRLIFFMARSDDNFRSQEQIDAEREAMAGNSPRPSSSTTR